MTLISKRVKLALAGGLAIVGTIIAATYNGYDIKNYLTLLVDQWVKSPLQEIRDFCRNNLSLIKLRIRNSENSSTTMVEIMLQLLSIIKGFTSSPKT